MIRRPWACESAQTSALPRALLVKAAMGCGNRPMWLDKEFIENS